MVAVIAEFADGDGLDDALFFDGLGQFGQCVFVKLSSGLERVGFDEVDVDLGHGSSYIVAADVAAGDIGFGTLKDGVKTASQSSFFIVSHCYFWLMLFFSRISLAKFR